MKLNNTVRQLDSNKTEKKKSAILSGQFLLPYIPVTLMPDSTP